MFKKLLVGSIVSVFLLAGCGNSGEKSGVNSTTTLTPDKPLAFYEDTKKNERIWFEVHMNDSVIAKDDIVKKIIIVKDGKLKFYDTDYFLRNTNERPLKPLYLSELDGKKSDELEKIGVARDKDHFEFQKKVKIKSIEDEVTDLNEILKETNISEEKKESWKEDIEHAENEAAIFRNMTYENPKTSEIHIETKTDNSGNTTINEHVFYKANDFDLDLSIKYVDFKTLERDFVYESLQPIPVSNIYNEYYGGFIFGKTEDTALITRADKKYEGQIVTKLDDEK